MKISSALAAIGVLFFSAAPAAAADLPAASLDAPVPPQAESGIWAAIAYSDIDQKHGFFWGADKR